MAHTIAQFARLELGHPRCVTCSPGVGIHVDLEAIYSKVMAGVVPGLFTDHEKLTVRLWDGMDGCWCDVEAGVSKERALEVWAERTKNGTERIAFREIDYYAIFPADTRMLWSGDREMFR